MIKIHPTAIVSEKAEIGENTIIGAYSIIEDDVVIGKDCTIATHVCIYNGARIGDRVKIGQGSSISNLPQDLKFNPDTKTYFYIGNDTVIREYVALHRGTDSHGFSKVGENCFLMAYSHVAHDCEIGNHCILANAVNIAGHCNIEDFVIIGGLTGVHQFSNVGRYSMIAACIKISQDVPPFVLAGSEPIRYEGLNKIGLRRRGFSNEDIDTIKDIYTLLYNSGMNFSQAKAKIAEKYPDNQYSNEILTFINKSKRGIIRK